MAESDKNEGEFIGSGRSGVVSKLESDGVTYAVKTFTAHDSLTKFICTVFLGAPNPYGWNRDAIACTHARRQILRSLLPLWQDVHAEVAQSFGTNWNEEHNAYELITEFIDGRHSALYHPYSSDREHETADLRSNVLRPLEKNLRDAGLKGMLWQAGYGNPSAESNFMIRDGKWIWIDLESGVPALFPLNVMKLFTFYLPEAIRNRRASFDEIDVSELKKYVNQSDFRDKMPSDKFEQLVTDIDTLAFHQKKWTDLKRIEKSVHYALARNRISEADALKYCASPLSWYCREGARFIGLSLAKALKWTRKFVRKIVAFELLRFMRNGFNFVFSSAIRHQ